VTWTNTEAPTVTVSPVDTATTTQTPQYTASASQTITASPTNAVLTATPSFTSTPQPSVTGTMPGTPTFTPTATRTQIDFFERTIQINQFYIYPNPSFGKLMIRYDIKGTAESVTIRVFTSAFRLVKVYSYSNEVTGVYDKLYDEFKAFSNGIYYVVLTCRSPESDEVKAITEMVILK
jgi:hypothetical protein